MQKILNVERDSKTFEKLRKLEINYKNHALISNVVVLNRESKRNQSVYLYHEYTSKYNLDGTIKLLKDTKSFSE